MWSQAVKELKMLHFYVGKEKAYISEEKKHSRVKLYQICSHLHFQSLILFHKQWLTYTFKLSSLKLEYTVLLVRTEK